MSTIATICARGGSRGVPSKNVKLLEGKPLIQHSIEHAFACDAIDHVFVSTDDQTIADVAREAGAQVPFLRPVHLATDSAPKLGVIEHLVDWVEQNGYPVTRIVDLDPTSPLRDIEDIHACLDLLDDNTDVVITGYQADKNPYFNMVEQQKDGYFNLVKSVPGGVYARQKAPAVYAMNASVYVWHRHTLEKGLWQGRARLHIMPRERSIDIDDPVDFKLVQLLMAEKREGDVQ